MNQQFYKSIENSTAHRPIRDMLSATVFNELSLFNELLNVALNISDKSHYKACWILELVLEKELTLLQNRLTEFCDALPNYKHDGAIRSVSKICLFLVKHNLKRASGISLSEKQAGQITEACFDWLIGNAKVASKAYAMKTLYILGKNEGWIYPELRQILSQDFMHHSAGYKAAAKDILKKINL